MKLSASIYSNNGKNLEQLVRELEAHNIDMLHVDCKDNPAVFDDIRTIRTLTHTPIDLHLITPTPEKYFGLIEELKVDYVCLQYENLKAIPALPKGGATQWGLALSSGTSIGIFEQATDFDFVLIMATIPGESGGKFRKENFKKIIDFKNRYPHKQLHVDGGVDADVAYILRVLGVHSVVSGSYLMNHESLGAGMLSLHKGPTAENREPYLVQDFATPVNYLPVLPEVGLTFNQCLQTIEKFGLGFVLVTDAENKLAGIVSNADIRRALLRHMDNLNAVTTDNLINKKPVSITGSTPLHGMLRLLNNLHFIVLFLPVVDSQNRLQGAVLLNQLTRA